MKKILQVTASLKIGGLERVAYNYSKYQQNRNIQYIYLVYGKKNGEYEKDLIDMGVDVVHIDEPNNNYIHFIKQVHEVLIKYGPFDAVHSHPSFNSGLVMLAARFAKVPIRITHAHTDRSSIQLGFINKLYNRIMQFLIHKFATAYVAVSRNAGSYLFGKQFFEKNGQIILNGVDQSKFDYSAKIRNKIREELNLKDEILLGHTGTLNNVKNQEFLIDLMVTLKKRPTNNYKLLLVGDGGNRELLETSTQKLSLDKDIMFLGQSDRPEEYLMAMDIFLFPSKFEGLGLSAVEAQISGLPTLISDKVPQEVNASNDCYQLVLNQDLWIQKIIGINKNDKRTGIYLKKFDIDHQIRETERLYKL